MPYLQTIESQYHWIGTQIPQELESDVFIQFINAAHRARLGKKYSEQDRSALLGQLYVELGQVNEKLHTQFASQNYLSAIKHLSKTDKRKPIDEHLRQGAKLAIAQLLFARTTPEERHHNLQQSGTVRDLGRLMIQGAEVLADLPRYGHKRGEVLGVLSEIGFTGCFLTMGSLNNNPIAVPTSVRQDSPYTERGFGYDDTIAGVRQIGAADLNLVRYNNSSLDYDSVQKIQVKSGYSEGMHERYEADIAVVSAAEELFIESPLEYLEFGTSLLNYRGEPDRTLSIAASNIDLAMETYRHNTIEN